jgi:hypothetical protein
MNDEKYDAFGSDGPSVEPTLLIRFLLRKFDELLKTDNPKLPLAFKALSLGCVGLDDEAERELKSFMFPEPQIRNCRDVLARILARIEKGEFTNHREMEIEGDVSLPEWAHEQILITALIESRKMLDEDVFEFAPIIRLLGWIALQTYPRRLAEFEDVWKSSSDDPGEAIEKGLNVLRIAFMSKDKDVAFPRQKELRSRRIAQKPASLN